MEEFISSEAALISVIPLAISSTAAAIRSAACCLLAAVLLAALWAARSLACLRFSSTSAGLIRAGDLLVVSAVGGGANLGIAIPPVVSLLLFFCGGVRAFGIIEGVFDCLFKFFFAKWFYEKTERLVLAGSQFCCCRFVTGHDYNGSSAVSVIDDGISLPYVMKNFQARMTCHIYIEDEAVIRGGGLFPLEKRGDTVGYRSEIVIDVGNPSGNKLAIEKIVVGNENTCHSFLLMFLWFIMFMYQVIFPHGFGPVVYRDLHGCNLSKAGCFAYYCIQHSN
ncbi:hypothetical protein [Desulfolithobacter sp.]